MGNTIIFKTKPHEVCGVSSKFGRRTIKGEPDFHYGIDIRAKVPGKVGDKLYATDYGVVRVNKANKGGPSKGLGWYMVIEYFGYCLLYGHMHVQSNLVVGTVVEPGQVVGIMGNSGFSTGPHVHLGLKRCKYERFWTADYEDFIDSINEIKNRKSEDNMFSQTEFDKMMDMYFAKRAEKGPSDWAKERWEKATEEGIVDGTRPQAMITREEAMQMGLNTVGLHDDIVSGSDEWNDFWGIRQLDGK